MRRGDLGMMGQPGYVTITGRSKDMVIGGGENICPREIEERGGRLNAAQTGGVAGAAVLRLAA
jgi:acyl-CoA synthetase (AMP-forming)/AMP-acid ligase II